MQLNRTVCTRNQFCLLGVLGISEILGGSFHTVSYFVAVYNQPSVNMLPCPLISLWGSYFHIYIEKKMYRCGVKLL